MDKLIEQTNYYKEYFQKPLFDMISLNYWIPDELHIILRITDRLWDFS